jgi:hypothetical protein
MKLFLTGFLQVFLVTFQTWLIAKNMIIFIFPVAFMISFTWSFNVKKTALGTIKERVIYSLGASCGALAGIITGNLIKSTI